MNPHDDPRTLPEPLRQLVYDLFAVFDSRGILPEECEAVALHPLGVQCLHEDDPPAYAATLGARLVAMVTAVKGRAARTSRAGGPLS